MFDSHGGRATPTMHRLIQWFPYHCTVKGSCKINGTKVLAHEGEGRRERKGGGEAKEEEGGGSVAEGCEEWPGL